MTDRKQKKVWQILWQLMCVLLVMAMVGCGGDGGGDDNDNDDDDNQNTGQLDVNFGGGDGILNADNNIVNNNRFADDFAFRQAQASVASRALRNQATAAAVTGNNLVVVGNTNIDAGGGASANTDVFVIVIDTTNGNTFDGFNENNGEGQPLIIDSGQVDDEGGNPVGNVDLAANDVIIDSDGKIVIVGRAENDLLLLRLDIATTPTIDTATAFRINGLDAEGRALIEQNDKIVVAGRSLVDNNNNGQDILLARFVENGGTLIKDGTFAQFFDTGDDEDDLGNDLVADGDKVVIAAVGNNGNNTDAILLRVEDGNNNFILDDTFGAVGVVVGVGNGGVDRNEQGLAVLLDANEGRYVLAGFAENANNQDLAIWAFDQADGAIDDTFDEGVAPDGLVVDDNAAGGNGNDVANDILLVDGNYVAVGLSQRENGVRALENDFTIWSFQSQGDLDIAGFNPPNGFNTVNQMAGNAISEDEAFAVVTSNGFLVVGESQNNDDDEVAVIAKFND